MCETFSISSSLKKYNVVLGENLLKSILSISQDGVVIDANVEKLWPSLNLNTPMSIEAIEEKKVLMTVAEIVEAMRERGMTRKSVLLSIGGGIIQDISTFAASCYMRGVKWVYAPTTLLGMVDSCIGGKSSINVGQFKNIAGNFFPPEKIIIDVNFCKTLSEQQLIEGLCESVKICYAHSENRFIEYLSIINSDKELHDQDFQKIVSCSLKTKKEFIEEDEFDDGIRLLLNFGHTFGHALESASCFKVSHGIAVGLGMFSAYKLSVELGLIKPKTFLVIKLLTHIKKLLDQVDGLTKVIENINMIDAVDSFKSDKKHFKDCYMAILYEKDGSLVRHKFTKSDKNNDLILTAFEYLKVINSEI